MPRSTREGVQSYGLPPVYASTPSAPCVWAAEAEATSSAAAGAGGSANASGFGWPCWYRFASGFGLEILRSVNSGRNWPWITKRIAAAPVSRHASRLGRIFVAVVARGSTRGEKFGEAFGDARPAGFPGQFEAHLLSSQVYTYKSTPTGGLGG